MMGWTSYNTMYCNRKSNGAIDRKVECDSCFNQDSRFVVVKSAMVGTVYYAAIEDKKTNDVFAAVFLTKIDGGCFFYKDMDETAMPCECKCPKSILNLLTPTKSKWANQWRENCLEYHKQQKNPKQFKNIAEGTRVLWTVANDGWGVFEQGDTVYLTKKKPGCKKRYAWVLDDGRYIDPKSIDTNEYEII